MPHVVFLPVPMWGHLQPCLPLMRGLRAHGVGVTAFVSAPFSAAVRACGASAVEVVSSVEDPRAPGSEEGTDFIGLGFKWLDEARAVVPQALDATLRLRPTAVVGCSLSLGARCLAYKLGIPHVQVFPSYPANEHSASLASLWIGTALREVRVGRISKGRLRSSARIWGSGTWLYQRYFKVPRI